MIIVVNNKLNLVPKLRLAVGAATMNAVVVIKNVLSDREIEALTRDCSHASRNFTSQQQFVDTSCGKFGVH